MDRLPAEARLGRRRVFLFLPKRTRLRPKRAMAGKRAAKVSLHPPINQTKPKNSPKPHILEKRTVLRYLWRFS